TDASGGSRPACGDAQATGAACARHSRARSVPEGVGYDFERDDRSLENLASLLIARLLGVCGARTSVFLIGTRADARVRRSCLHCRFSSALVARAIWHSLTVAARLIQSEFQHG